MTDVEVFKKTKGPNKGKLAIRIKGLRVDKSYKLSICNPELRNSGEADYDKVVQNKADKYCPVFLHQELTRRYNAVHPGYSGRVFRRAVRKGGKTLNIPNMKENGVIGKNRFSIMTKSIAHRCKMTKPDKCTSGGRRRAGITQLANKANGVSEAARMHAARHSCPSTHAKYQERSEECQAQRSFAMEYRPEDYGTFYFITILFIILFLTNLLV